MKIWNFYSRLIISGFMLSVGMLFANCTQAAEPTESIVLHYDLDFSQVPDLYYHDVTLKIQVGQTSSVTVFAGGRLLPHRYEARSGKVIVTTDNPSLDVYVANANTAASGFGEYEMTTLFDDKKWAWSHGFDDNVSFGESIDLYKELDYQATVFIIGDIVDMERTEYWIVDASSGMESNPQASERWVTGIKELIELEWGFGNHGWGSHSSCDTNGDLEWEVLRNNQLAMDIVTQSNNPSYKPIALAAPCFMSEYHDLVLALRDNGVARPEFQNIPYYIQFNESGNIEAPYVLDSDTDFTSGDLTAKLFDFDAPISRDYRIESDAAAVRDVLDWMAANTTDERHFWYNTLAHGDNNENIANVLNYAHDNYGKAGNNEGWIAPSDRIYSYLLTKDSVQVNFLGYEPGEPPIEEIFLPITLAWLDYFHFDFEYIISGWIAYHIYDSNQETAVLAQCIP